MQGAEEEPDEHSRPSSSASSTSSSQFQFQPQFHSQPPLLIDANDPIRLPPPMLYERPHPEHSGLSAIPPDISINSLQQENGNRKRGHGHLEDIDDALSDEDLQKRKLLETMGVQFGVRVQL